jgi:cell division protein FtsZ
MYEVASEDALITRGLSSDDSLGENISITVIATGFEANSIIQPAKPKKPKEVELLSNSYITPPHIIPQKNEESFKVKEKGRSSIITDFEEESQDIYDFRTEGSEDMEGMHERDSDKNEDENRRSEITLQKVKHIQKILKKEGLSDKTMKENIETFEDVPAYIRRNMSLETPDSSSETKPSKYTLTSDDEDGPVIRENNAYLNDNVD